LSTPSDHELGQRLGQWIQQAGDGAFEGGVLSRRLQAQLQDLLGADTTLLHPLRDLLQRPAFRQLFSGSSQGQTLHARDALLRDLAEVYSPVLLNRLDGVLQGCLNLPAANTNSTGHEPAWPGAAAAYASSGYGASATNASAYTSSAYNNSSYNNSAYNSSASTAAAPSATGNPIPGPAPTVVTIQQPRQQGPAAVLIALLALICGALVMTLAGVLLTSRNAPTTGQAQAPATPPSAPAPTPAPTPQEPVRPAPEPAQTGQWQACVDYSSTDGPPPQAGETWWPVVGPAEALDASRQHCRGDAFTNASGNAQIASFRDRETATAFAQQLTSDSSHPYSFWVGDPTVR